MTAIDTHAVPSAPNGASAGPPPPANIPGKPARRSYIGDVAAAAEQIRFARVLLAVLTAPFYVIGFVVGMLWLVARWAIGGVQIGFRHASRVRTGPGGE